MSTINELKVLAEQQGCHIIDVAVTINGKQAYLLEGHSFALHTQEELENILTYHLYAEDTMQFAEEVTDLG